MIYDLPHASGVAFNEEISWDEKADNEEGVFVNVERNRSDLIL